MSANDVVTAILAFGAIAVSVVALVINSIAGRRAARSALTDLTLKVGKKAAAFRQLQDGDDKYYPSQEIEVLIRQADYLIEQQLRGKSFPESIAVTLAQVLEWLNDPWWADKYWAKAATVQDPYFRATTLGYWGLALWDRGEHKRGDEKTREAVAALTLQSTEAYIVRGDICLHMASCDPAWFARARQEYQRIPMDDERHNIYLNAVDQKQQAMSQASRETAGSG